MEGTIMTNKALILGVVVLCALPAAAQAQVLLSENFDELTPGTVPNGAKVGPDFTGTNVVIAGPTFNHGNCRPPAASGNCLVLANTTGSLKSVPVTLVGGHTYDLSFDVQGNSLIPATGPTSEVTVTLGSLFDRTFTLTNGSPIDFKSVVDPITVPTAVGRESVVLLFEGTGSHIATNGPVIDNILLTSAPEPATLGLLVLGLLGAGFAGRKRRN
jgi:hypothetical protein